MSKRNEKEEENGLHFSNYKTFLNDRELAALDTELQKYIDIGEFDEVQFLKDKGALNHKGEVIITNVREVAHPKKRTGETIIDCDPILYEEWSSKLNQWRIWKGRKEFAIKKKFEALDEIGRQYNESPR